MNKKTFLVPAVVVFCVCIAAFVSIAGGAGGIEYADYPVFVLCAAMAFAINWAAFIPANIAKTERYYDLTGSFTYLSVIALAVVLAPTLDLRAKLVAVLVVVWALRLGTFLFRRISRDGKDDRFDAIKHNAPRFFLTWTLQALWVVMTAACALAILTSSNPQPIGIVGYIGVGVWVFGFVIEVVADQQKSAFKRENVGQGSDKFIQSGLWSWSRHPNYFGEITLWAGIALIAMPILSGWQWVVLISPVFVFVLINFVSGVNKLEEKAESKWGGESDYIAYRERTNKLILWPPKNA